MQYSIVVSTQWNPAVNRLKKLTESRTLFQVAFQNVCKSQDVILGQITSGKLRTFENEAA